jgi:ATP-dependent DNA helicase RecG
MTREELIARLNGFEWADFECKKAQRSVPKDAYITVSAFANTAGGWLLFGVSQKHGQLQVTGVDPDAFDQVQNDFLSTLRSGQKFNHVISVDPHTYELDGKRILAFHIPQSPRRQKPVYLKGNLQETYIRRAAGDERATDAELQRLLRDAATKSWDTASLPDVDVHDCIENETLTWYQSQFYRRNPEQRQLSDPIEFLREWNFVVDEDGQSLPTRAAVLLFGTDRCVRALLPRPVLDYQRIDVRAQDWSPEERWHDRLLFEENLFNTWRGLVTKYSRFAEHPFRVDPSTMRRNDDPPDYIAFREASINLLIHQDYGDVHRKASLKVFTDQTVFWNPGDAFATQRELLESTEKEIRNPLLVNAFRRIGLSDQAGTGIRAIYRNWHDLGHRPPMIENDKAGKSFGLVLSREPLITDAIRRFHASLGVKLSSEQADILALAAEQPHISLVDAGVATGGNLRIAHEALDFLVRQQLLQTLGRDNFSLTEPIKARLESIARENLSPRLSVEGRDQAGTKLGPSRDQVEIMRKCLTKKPIGELMQAIGRTNRTKFRDQVLKPLLEAGWLEMTIPDKPTSSKQQYRLTEAGMDFLGRIQ